MVELPIQGPDMLPTEAPSTLTRVNLQMHHIHPFSPSVQTKTENSDTENDAFRKRSLRWINVKTMGLRCSVDRRRLSETMTFDCHDTAMTLPQACT